MLRANPAIVETMSLDEMSEEVAQEARAPFDKKVAATIAVIAALLAVVSVFGQLMANEELLLQAKASDTWAQYQAKSIRRYSSEIAHDTFGNVAGEASAKLSEKYISLAEKYKHDDEEISKQAKEYEDERDTKGRKALRLHFAEIFLEAGMALGSLAILTKLRLVWAVSICSALGGAAIAATVFTIAG
jgi:hypothetical protein